MKRSSGCAAPSLKPVEVRTPGETGDLLRDEDQDQDEGRKRDHNTITRATKEENRKPGSGNLFVRWGYESTKNERTALGAILLEEAEPSR